MLLKWSLRFKFVPFKLSLEMIYRFPGKNISTATQLAAKTSVFPIVSTVYPPS